MFNGHDHERARSALLALDPDCPEKAARSPQEPLKARPAGTGAAEIRRRLEPATSSKPHIAGKQAEGVPLERLQVVPKGDSLCIAGQSVVGWLAVPMMPMEGGHPSSLQLIPPSGVGNKPNLPGLEVSGAFIVVDLRDWLSQSEAA
jgi:hypothetical protein